MFSLTPLEAFTHGDDFRALSVRDSERILNPFLGVDHAWMGGPTFPPHRHAGMCAVSYLFADSETGVLNRDSIGTRNLIRPGGMHWMTAGSGIVHEEVPAESGKTVHSLQIFVDLSDENKSLDPFALIVEPEDVPVVQRGGATIRIPVGNFDGVRSPVTPPTPVTILDLSLAAGAEIRIPLLTAATGQTLFVLVISGAIACLGRRFDADGPAIPVVRGPRKEEGVTVAAADGPAQAVVFIGAQLHS
ncbi:MULTISPECIES: pirin family protein [unclassified Caballeronia]|jgi:redox-sensitive bicupin YhaK (pirin superfamily)|uniref:pirin family protein n=1 Tax=unclassified Caballeronia TaxID=2646786 RepID=UPI0020290E74|nr:MULTISPECIES: pirin family protein [unclassified Caballeronia]